MRSPQPSLTDGLLQPSLAGIAVRTRLLGNRFSRSRQNGSPV